MTAPHIVIFGAGPAGLGAAFRLTQKGKADVSVLEQNVRVGGTAGSFDLSGVTVDYGSHRLHPACSREILSDIHGLLGEDLLDRPRHGRIRLRGRWIHFPLKPIDLALRMPPSFALGTTTDLIGKLFKNKPHGRSDESFASALESGLGQTISRDFYFPYAQKLWGLPPEELSVTQARRRVSADSMGKMFRKILNQVPGMKPNGAGRFFYPRAGFGQISERFYESAKSNGAEFHLGSRVISIHSDGKRIDGVTCEEDGGIINQKGDLFWSTIPVNVLVKSMEPSAPPEIIEASENIEYRAMILIYLVLDQDQFSEYDAHYFPEPDFPVTRISEPKNYSDVIEPKDRTVLCAELPCSPGDKQWKMTDEELGSLVRDCLKYCGVPVTAPVKEVATRRLREAYPVYRKGYEVFFDKIDRWLNGIENLLSFGRQGLFVHDNTHHALYMAYSAVECLDGNGRFDNARWEDFRKTFATHVVED